MAKQKPVVSLRKPPKPAAPEDADNFVNGSKPASNGQMSTVDGQVSTSEASERLPRGAVKRASGEVLRRFTVYLDPSDSDRLRRHCFENELDLSEVAAMAIHEYLEKLSLTRA